MSSAQSVCGVRPGPATLELFNCMNCWILKSPVFWRQCRAFWLEQNFFVGSGSYLLNKKNCFKKIPNFGSLKPLMKLLRLTIGAHRRSQQSGPTDGANSWGPQTELTVGAHRLSQQSGHTDRANSRGHRRSQQSGPTDRAEYGSGISKARSRSESTQFRNTACLWFKLKVGLELLYL